MREPLLIIERAPSAHLSTEEIQAIAETLDEVSSRALSHPTTQGRRYDLSFYEDVELVELTNPAWEPEGARVCFLRHPERLAHLGGASVPIHEMNSLAELTLNEETVLGYLAFFCFFVRGDDGPFLIVDRPDNPFVPNIDPISDLTDRFREPRLWGQSDDGAFQASALVCYAHALFFADFIIRPDGMIEMLQDEPLKEFDGLKVVAPLRIQPLTDQTVH